ncbi:hypothetical protein K445DRAFT_335147 [Daldinia sp. EC12]|nr:hypothetical protein K445DRAFT_335147 [Daldinia sp. EC12]
MLHRLWSLWFMSVYVAHNDYGISSGRLRLRVAMYIQERSQVMTSRERGSGGILESRDESRLRALLSQEHVGAEPWSTKG